MERSLAGSSAKSLLIANKLMSTVNKNNSGTTSYLTAERRHYLNVRE